MSVALVRQACNLAYSSDLQHTALFEMLCLSGWHVRDPVCPPDHNKTTHSVLLGIQTFIKWSQAVCGWLSLQV
jgi:hypothetical protein